MRRGKYIVFENGGAVVFGAPKTHAEIADGRPARSAGHFRLDEKGLRVFGGSQSLGLHAADGDEILIAPLLGISPITN